MVLDIKQSKFIKKLGAKVFTLGVKPNGLNINLNAAQHINKIQSAVKKYKAKLGISLDGDADRIIMCDERNIIDGDQIIAMLAKRWKLKKFLKEGSWNVNVKLHFEKVFKKKK